MKAKSCRVFLRIPAKDSNSKIIVAKELKEIGLHDLNTNIMRTLVKKLDPCSKNIVYSHQISSLFG